MRSEQPSTVPFPWRPDARTEASGSRSASGGGAGWRQTSPNQTPWPGANRAAPEMRNLDCDEARGPPDTRCRWWRTPPAGAVRRDRARGDDQEPSQSSRSGESSHSQSHTMAAFPARDTRRRLELLFMVTHYLSILAVGFCSTQPDGTAGSSPGTILGQKVVERAVKRPMQHA